MSAGGASSSRGRSECCFGAENARYDLMSPNIFRFLCEAGAARSILTDQGERPVDLVDPGDARMLAVMLAPLEKKR